MDKKFIAGLLVCLMATPLLVGVVSADGGLIPLSPTADVSVYGLGQKAIIAWNGEEEILILSTDVYASEDSPVLRIVPLPSNPKAIEKGNFSSFEEIESLIRRHAPSLPPYLHPPGYGAEPVKVGAGINITFHEKVGAHDITVVEVNDVYEFIQWTEDYLRGHKIEKDISGDKLEVLVSDYIERDLNFFVFDLIEAGAERKSIEPITYRFECDFVYYPLKISKLASGNVNIDVFAITNGIIDRSSISVLRIAEWHYGHGYGYFHKMPIEFSLSLDEVESISHKIAELFDNGAWLTALTYKGPLEGLDDDLKATPPMPESPEPYPPLTDIPGPDYIRYPSYIPIPIGSVSPNLKTD